MGRKIFVSGCYDMLHSGHVEFFRQAAEYGDLYVALGSDRTVLALKGRLPVNNEQERLFMVQAVRHVKEAFISRGAGKLDFKDELLAIQPDMLIVNEDGDLPEKRALCTDAGIEYMVLQRKPYAGLPQRSTTALREDVEMPFRIDLAGGWLDQPWVSSLHPGAVLTISIEPTVSFNARSGMASSTRRAAIDLWGRHIPPGEHEKLAKMLFCYDNPPGTKIISGSQDAIGIVFPGLAKAHYAGGYWPERIDHVLDGQALDFVENSLHLVSLGERHADYDVLAGTRITAAGAKALADAADGCWQAILVQDLERFGHFFRTSFDAQVAMFPHMMNNDVQRLIDKYQAQALGWKLSGAGGGGYLILVAAQPVEGAIRVQARR